MFNVEVTCSLSVFIYTSHSSLDDLFIPFGFSNSLPVNDVDAARDFLSRFIDSSIKELRNAVSTWKVCFLCVYVRVCVSTLHVLSTSIFTKIDAFRGTLWNKALEYVLSPTSYRFLHHTYRGRHRQRSGVMPSPLISRMRLITQQIRRQSAWMCR